MCVSDVLYVLHIPICKLNIHVYTFLWPVCFVCPLGTLGDVKSMLGGGLVIAGSCRLTVCGRPIVGVRRVWIHCTPGDWYWEGSWWWAVHDAWRFVAGICWNHTGVDVVAAEFGSVCFPGASLLKDHISHSHRHRFINAADARSTRREQTKLPENHEEAGTKLILHACESADRGYERVLVICRDTDVLVLLLHFMSVVNVWMIAGTAKNQKCYPVHEVSQSLTQPVRDNLLNFHALTGCDTTSTFSGHGKKSS